MSHTCRDLARPSVSGGVGDGSACEVGCMGPVIVCVGPVVEGGVLPAMSLEGSRAWVVDGSRVGRCAATLPVRNGVGAGVGGGRIFWAAPVLGAHDELGAV